MNSIEATIICIDNSDYNRNEDIVPNRFLSQIDCVNVLCCNKTSVHYKNNIGILTMAGDKTKVKVSLTNDIGQLLSCIHDIKLDGTCDILRSLLIAQLALKHRVDKNLEQKIILFVGSPIDVNEKQLINTGKQLKKNNISVDIISYGNINKNREKLMKLYDSVNNNDNCRFIECPEVESNLSKFVLNSFLSNNDFNIDNIQDDEQLINAMQLSLEDSHHMADSKNVNSSNNNMGNSNHISNSNDLPTIQDIENMKDIDNELKEALILSLKEYTEKNKQEDMEQKQKGKQEVQSTTGASDADNSANAANGTTQKGSGADSAPNSTSGMNGEGKKEENLTLVNESYKNNFDNNNEEIELEESKEKKENESYEKVFKIDKDENIDHNSKCVINENIYNADESVAKDKDNPSTSNEGATNQSNSFLIQDSSYISNILGQINPLANVFDKTAAIDENLENKQSVHEDKPPSMGDQDNVDDKEKGKK
ncbi:26S proteasome regulatory subunit RPN10, putative [Plasmodium malariae]|uniref:26S proteasome regulatory subunit RPN10, putative n=1 Tax=Plasmodium malariae TaxID=5858 RepID=A0A1D3JKA5_PLAMA|nr:26S proteasome regulatory subunit RPN10, putative [Plasmodium malariae]SBT86947.1 26S proteasome regulatory subunit RPN10, putative [Plasmodium malariae]